MCIVQVIKVELELSVTFSKGTYKPPITFVGDLNFKIKSHQKFEVERKIQHKTLAASCNCYK